MAENYESIDIGLLAAIIIIIAGMVFLIFKLGTDFMKKKNGSKRAMAQTEQLLQNSTLPSTNPNVREYQRMMITILEQMKFIEDLALEEPQYALKYQQLFEESIELRNLIRKEMGYIVLWKNGDPHPIRDRFKWKLVRDARVNEYLQKGILYESSFAADGTIRDWKNYKGLGLVTGDTNGNAN
jgi:hypothetical protein